MILTFNVTYKWLLVGIVLIFIPLLWPIQLSLLNDPYCTVVEDHEGHLLSAQIATDGQWRFPLIDSLPASFIDCITSYEDARYFYHPGVDIISGIRALQQNYKAGRVVSGASTIPMQLMRMSSDHNDRSLRSKIIESVGALRLDFQYDKDYLLRLYASHAPFGGNVVGLEAAAWKYFNRDPYNLSWAEMATLAVLPNAPSLIRFDKSRDRLLEKRNFLLKKLHADNKIDKIELELSLEEPLGSGWYELPHIAPHLLEWLKKKEIKGKIISNIHKEVQVQINQILNRHYAKWSSNSIHNAAVMVIDNSNGDIIAYNANIPATTEEEHVDMIQAERSSGSILKPLLYASMIEEGLITPRAYVQDIPLFIDGFRPTNYDGNFKGLIGAAEALSRSLNVPFVVLLREFGVEKFRKKLFQSGLSSIDQSGSGYYGLSLILGGAEVTLYELTKVYSNMASTMTQSYGQGWSRSSVFHTLEAMRKLQRPSLRGEWEQYSSSRVLAWKTGTSFGHRDAWSIGITPQYTIGVWVGNADGEGREDIIGVSTAGAVLFDVVDILEIDDAWFETPYDEMLFTEVCASSGMLPSIQCTDKSQEWIAKSSIESPVCHFHEIIQVDKAGKWRVNNSCYEDEILSKSFLNMTPIQAKYYYNNNPNLVKAPPWHPDCISEGYNDLMEFIYPNPNEKLYVPLDFNGRRQNIVVELIHKRNDAKVYWYLDEHFMGSTSTFHKQSIGHDIGYHTLYCIDDTGTEKSVSFEIIGERKNN